MRESAGGIIKGPDGRIVLVNQGSNVWSFPKGAVEAGEDSLQAAIREIEEETGITDLTLVQLLGSYKRRRIGKGGVGEVLDEPEYTRTLFFFTTTQAAIRPQEGEIVEVRWVSLDEAYELLTHPKDKEFFNSVRSIIEQ